MKSKRIMVAARIILALILLFSCMLFVGCKDDPDDYTLKEHIERITPRIERRFINGETRDNKYSFITGYQAYPLYNSEDKLEYFLIEFEPYGFAFISLNKEIGVFNREMYRCDDRYFNRKYELNGNGNHQEYDRSPYTVANALQQKMYFLDVNYGYVPAIKQNGSFINLISMEEFEYQGDAQFYKKIGQEYVLENIPLLSISFFAGLGGEL